MLEKHDSQKANEKFAEYLTTIGAIKERKPNENDESKLLLETKKEISEIKVRLSKIEEILSNVLKQEKQYDARSGNLQKEVRITQNTTEIDLDTRKAEKKEYAEINTLRNEIATIERQLRLLEISAALRIEINNDLKKKRERVTDLIKSLVDANGPVNI